MNPDDIKCGLYRNQDLIEEEKEEELEGSQMSFFRRDRPSAPEKDCIIENMDQYLPTHGTVQLTENDDFNYSESNYHYAPSSSLGAIIQGVNGGGSFVCGGLANYASSSNMLTHLNPIGAQALTSGRESSTPFNYDENSLMNLSQTPTSVALSKFSKNANQRIISSTKLNHRPKHDHILEDRTEEED